MSNLWERLKAARLKVAWALAIILVGYIAITATVALQSIALVACKLVIGAIVGLHADRGLFPYARPSYESPFNQWQYRRAAIVCAAMLGMAIGI